MSADNWEICPRCSAKRAESLSEQRRKVDAAYGTVPVAEFDAMRADLAARVDERPRPTFREDYEIGLDGDEFYVIYKGSCQECGLKHEFTHGQVLA